jgi:hypothetical protein
MMRFHSDSALIQVKGAELEIAAPDFRDQRGLEVTAGIYAALDERQMGKLLNEGASIRPNFHD